MLNDVMRAASHATHLSSQPTWLATDGCARVQEGGFTIASEKRNPRRIEGEQA